MGTPKPAWADGEYGEYENIVRSWGYEVLDISRTGSYQGDYEALVRDGQRFGIAIFGYGSCSGCDALEAAWPWGYDDEADYTEVEALRARLRDDVTWFDVPADGIAWIDRQLDTDTPGSWYAYDDEVRGVLMGYRATLEGADS